MQKVRCRWSPTLGELEGTAEKAWGTVPYNPQKDQDESCVFFGLYSLNDFYALWRHRGKKWVLWCGTDILHFKKGYWLDTKGKIHIDPTPLAKWLNQECENWCENVAEQKALRECGIKAKICPSFMGDVNDFKVTFQSSAYPSVYASVSGDNFKMYGWDVIERVAGKVPSVQFYLFGNKTEWKTKHKNVEVMGRVKKEQMNAMISWMTAGIRPLEFDGASEILMKSVLMGQYPISRIPYPHIDSYKNDSELLAVLKKLPFHTKPNLKGRNWYIKNLNKFPWVK